METSKFAARQPMITVPDSSSSDGNSIFCHGTDIRIKRIA
jgi:hypothetical protein